ncbi:MAG: sigma-70 family RNA polymerase sigma factor [Planctomycetia bacterium]|nr:sigma-70 family RNA polymerase sigma factor [Planctomycetia bacterium]
MTENTSNTQSTTSDAKDRATALFLQYHNLVRQIAFQLAPATDLVNDITHDVFINFVSHAERWDLDRDVVPLLWKITQNIAKQHWRQHKKQLPEKLGLIFEYLRQSESEPDLAEIVDQKMELLALELCMEKLSPKYRTFLEAYYFSEVKLVEIAETQHIKIGTLQKTMCRIRSALMTCVQQVISGKGPDHV